MNSFLKNKMKTIFLINFANANKKLFFFYKKKIYDNLHKIRSS